MITDNLALYKPCRQSTTYDGHLAGKAVNGKLDDFTQTNPEPAGKWWMVDLEEKFHVSRIKIYNRKYKGYLHCIYNYNRYGACCYVKFLLKMIWFYMLN